MSRQRPRLVCDSANTAGKPPLFVPVPEPGGDGSGVTPWFNPATDRGGGSSLTPVLAVPFQALGSRFFVRVPGSVSGLRVRSSGDGGRWVVRHRAGATRYQHAVAGLEQQLAVAVAPDDPVKLA
jgi:hypothetical protein